jgi:hypothetical protein
MVESRKLKVLVADYDYGDVDIERAIVERAGMELIPAQCKSEDEVIEKGRDADGILNQYAEVRAKAIEALPNLKVISRYGTGVDIVDVEAATRVPRGDSCRGSDSGELRRPCGRFGLSRDPGAADPRYPRAVQRA